MTKAGEKATVIQDGNGEKTFIEVVATEQAMKNKPAVLMKFVVGKIDKDGQRKIVAQPQIMALEGQKAQIETGNNGGVETVSLSVVATPQ